MTTVLIKPEMFFAVDSKWTSKLGIELVSHTVTKFLNRSDVIGVYAGDELPIVLHQALLSKALSPNEYIENNLRLNNLNSNFKPEDQFSYESTILCFPTGVIKTSSAQQPSFPIDLFYQGTGGKHAADFYYYSHKKPFLSAKGCNILGAMYYAFHKDMLYSGGSITKVEWKGSTQNISNLVALTELYKTTLKERIEELFMYHENQLSASAVKAVSSSAPHAVRKIITPPLRTGSGEFAAKTSLSRAVNTVKELQELGLI
ncbi:hypothetical protein [Vibrio nigripulchritudo]|uniref:hypothetical protein n=1 Tax=Vibrio nigripulchritudo TaxID=28173 RepID=UPI00248FEC88|nr:hypothetical protein [Vibrio nigripulchritudo]